MLLWLLRWSRTSCGRLVCSPTALFAPCTLGATAAHSATRAADRRQLSDECRTINCGSLFTSPPPFTSAHVSSPNPPTNRRQLPDKYRPIISGVIGGDMDYDALHRWFNSTFLIAATASLVRSGGGALLGLRVLQRWFNSTFLMASTASLMRPLLLGGK